MERVGKVRDQAPADLVADIIDETDSGIEVEAEAEPKCGKIEGVVWAVSRVRGREACLGDSVHRQVRRSRRWQDRRDTVLGRREARRSRPSRLGGQCGWLCQKHRLKGMKGSPFAAGGGSIGGEGGQPGLWGMRQG